MTAADSATADSAADSKADTAPPRQRAEMFLPAASDPRENGLSLAGERTTLAEFLRRQRETLRLKCAGLDAEQLARHNGHADLLHERIDGRIGM